MLKNLQPTVTGSRATSVWADYEQDRQHYSDEDLVQKRQFVREHLQGSRTVLDLGCNAGEFSQLAAECGATVIAADADHPALSRLYSRIRGHAQSVSPVLLNIGRPTPAVGWLNAEIGSFLDRAHRRFDCVMMLGLLHHLLVGERMTLAMLADMLDRLMPSRVILEWIAPKDPKFEQLAGLNAALYSHLDGHALEALLQQKFRLVAKMNLPCGTRVMYHWKREVKDDPAKH
jgi:SAM-dependent methyltransferase